MNQAVEEEVQGLLAVWEQEEAERKVLIADRKRQKLEILRDRMRAGTWKPSHQCADCVRSVLLCQPELACPETGRTGRWWL